MVFRWGTGEEPSTGTGGRVSRVSFQREYIYRRRFNVDWAILKLFIWSIANFLLNLSIGSCLEMLGKLSFPSFVHSLRFGFRTRCECYATANRDDVAGWVGDFELSAAYAASEGERNNLRCFIMSMGIDRGQKVAAVLGVPRRRYFKCQAPQRI